MQKSIARLEPQDEEIPHRIGYARVSTTDQDMRLQVDALLRDGVAEDDLYQETASSASKRRPEFEAMMREIRPGDVITVWKLDRLGRSLRQVLDTVDQIHEVGAKLRILTQHIDTSTAAGNLVLAVFAAVAEFERELIRERTRAGIEAARARGRVGGRRETYSDDQIREAVKLVQAGSTWRQAAETVRGRKGKHITVTRLRSRAEALQLV